jgi:hypothetical protein
VDESGDRGESGWRIGEWRLDANLHLSLRRGCSPLLEEKCTGRRPKIETVKALLPLQYVGWFSLMTSTVWAASTVSFSQPLEAVEVYDFVEVIARVDKPEARNPFLAATLTGSFAKTDGTDRKIVEGFCDSADGSVFRIRFAGSCRRISPKPFFRPARALWRTLGIRVREKTNWWLNLDWRASSCCHFRTARLILSSAS